MKLVDWDYMFSLIYGSIENHSNELDEIKEVFLSSSVDLAFVGDPSNLFRLTNSYKDQNKVHFVYELYNFDDFNFIDFTIDENQKVCDVFLYGAGLNLTKIITQSTIDRTVDKKNLLLYELAKKSLASKNFDDAWDQINLLPIEMQKKFPYQNLKIKIAESNLVLYSKLVSEIEKSTSENRFKYYLRLREAIFTNDHELILAASKELRKTVGESVTLLIFEATVDLDNGNNYNDAIEKYLKMIDLDPDFASSYISIVDVLLKNGNPEKAEKYFSVASKKFQILKADWLELLPEYTEFITEQFK